VAGGCYVARVHGNGRGAFAAQPFQPGETVLVFGGSLVALEQLADFTHCLEIAPALFLGPSGGVDDFVNHSCEPNCRVDVDAAGPVLRALRPVAPGEELTYDYSTLMVRDPTSFDCRCGSARCRGRIVAFGALPPDLREDYARRGLVPAFVLGSGR
jgi:hypothetical protein